MTKCHIWRRRRGEKALNGRLFSGLRESPPPFFDMGAALFAVKRIKRRIHVSVSAKKKKKQTAFDAAPGRSGVPPRREPAPIRI